LLAILHYELIKPTSVMLHSTTWNEAAFHASLRFHPRLQVIWFWIRILLSWRMIPCAHCWPFCTMWILQPAFLTMMSQED